jgi:apolipoprotein N-acyltransferase
MRKIHIMQRIRISTNFTVFLLFFGVALLEAIQSANWLRVAMWTGFGLLFLLADNLPWKKRKSGL